MKKSVIAVVALVLVAALSVGAYIILNKDINGGDNEETTTYSIGIQGYNEYDVANDVKKMTIKNLLGTFSFTPDPTVNGIDDKSWFLNDLGDMKSEAFAVNDIALAFYTITSSKKIDAAPEDLAKYGFDDPELVVTIEYNDGNSFTYSFGTSVGISSSESDYYCYLRRSGDDAIYLVENYFYDKAFISLKDVMTTELYPQLEDNVVINEISLSGTQGDTLKLEQVGDYLTYDIVSPYARGTDAIALSNLMSELSDIKEGVTVELAGAMDTPILEGTLRLYGLDNPARILNFKYTVDTTSVGEDGSVVKKQEPGEHTIKMGIIYDDKIYVMVDSINAIYLVPYSLLDSVYEASFDSLAVRNIYTEKLINIEEIKFDTSFKTFDYQITASTEVNSVKLNGKDLDVSTIKSLYASFAAIVYSERTTDKPTGNPYMTITVKRTTGVTDVIRFTEYNSRRYFATINGEGDMLVSYELVDSLLESLKATDKTTLG